MSKQEPKIESFFNIPTGESPQEMNPDQITFDKNNWNSGDMNFPDLNLKKESESKLSIDTPDISNQRLKEYLNEDLLNAIDVSPMATPKNIINENNEINMDHKDLFQFSLYNNNKNENDEKEEKEEKEEINELNVINELSKIKLDEINKIKEDEGGGNLNIINNDNINNINNNIDNENNDMNNIFDMNKDNIFFNNDNNINNINNININDNNKENNTPEKNNNTNIITEEKKEKENIEKKENKENTENKEKNNTSKKNYYQTNYQYPFIMGSYVTQPIINPMNPFGHENKFDGNKKYQVLVPFTVLKKNTKTKKPFEIREGDWTCSNCNNLNFSFRVKCNRCYISKEQSELDKNKGNKENKEQKIPQTKNKTYYPNNNVQYKYYPGFIYFPIQYQKKDQK